jgi:hypothetical protein
MKLGSLNRREKTASKIHHKCRLRMQQCFHDSYRAQGHDKNAPCILKRTKTVIYTTYLISVISGFGRRV